jgi:hypothetical protein
MAKRATQARKSTARQSTAVKNVKAKTAQAKKAPRARKSPASKVAVAPRPGRGLTAAVKAVGPCLDDVAAGEIVQGAIPGGPHDIDSTLEDAGLISAGQRTVFRADVVNGVRDRGCTIDGSDVPNNPTTTLRDVRTAVADNAHA